MQRQPISRRDLLKATTALPLWTRQAQAAAEGVDTYVTGEGPHHTYALAEDAGLNVFYGGHYATETFGVKALAAELSRRFKVPWEFLDHPTGL